MTTEANQVAESSAATAVIEPIRVENFDDSQRAEWLKSGTLPVKEQPKTDDTAASKPGTATEETSGAAKEAESGTAAKTKSDKQERNWRALESRAEKAERELAELKAKSEKPVETKVAPSPAPQDLREPQPPERPKRPALTEFKSVGEFDVAMDKYDAAMSEFGAKSQAYETAKAAAEKARTEITELNKKAEDKWKGMVSKAEEKYPDFKTIALSDELTKQIPINSPVDEWLLQAEVGAEMLYHFGQNPEDLKRILALSRPAQHRELAKLEDKLSEPAVKEPPKKEPKVVTDAFPPPKEVGGKGTAAEDEEAAALKRAAAGDDEATSRYIELANKREMAKVRSRR